ncbi:MAG: hypothetical protein U0324_23225 [Polyangiales bacterium]
MRSPFPLLLVCLAALAATACDGSDPVGTVDATVPTDIRSTDGAKGDGDESDVFRGCGLVTCESAGATCGPVGDGCGNIIQCGTCAAPQTCGGGGVPSRCGGTSGCVPRTCAALGVRCGPAADGCGGLLECGGCPDGQTCGGGGSPGVCGSAAAPMDGGSSCVRRTCAGVGANCGPVSDGCGGLLDCGTCTSPQTCGGAGVANQCGGSSACVRRTCAGVNADCGPVSDGCGGLLMCGTCAAGQTCGAVAPNRCGVPGSGGSACAPRTCGSLGANCGPVSDGCGGLLMCGTCPAGQTCGGGGVASQCGAPRCVPRTCAAAGANCGPVADGCGGLLSCGTCVAPQTCGGGGRPSVCGSPGGGMTTCTNLCLRRATCAAGVVTTISGRVVTPARMGPDPLYNAVVYIPNAAVAPFTPGVSCDRCGSPTSGSPVVSAVTAADGTFTLRDVPVGANIPLVVQIGRWRRQVTIPMVNPCVDNALTTEYTRLPRNRMEGDIPLTAMVTGDVDALECVLRKIGVDDGEFTTPAGGGRIQFYVANGANAGRMTPAANTLYNAPATLARYDMVLFACEGSHIDKDPAAQRNVVNYANAGGRVFATHFSYTWLYNIAPFSSVARWNIRQANPPNPLTGLIDTSFPRGAAFAQWLTLVGAAAGANRISITDPRHDVDAVVAPTARWIYSTTPGTVQHLTFNTPVGAAADAQCGRVLFSDFHVSGARTGGRTFPMECSNTPLTAQEKVLEFMLFDLASCVAPDMPRPPTCTPRTCMQAGANCGPIGDGCGATLNCGTCTAPQTCGGGGVPSVCGTPTCARRTCAQQMLSCGPAGDGCGGTLDCGPCAAGTTCGGGGRPGQCGAPACRPRTCADQMLQCGPAGDGCGNVIQCGNCPSPQTCGGGGTPGVCGRGVCTPRTCAGANAECGPVADGCGGVLDCGTCVAPLSCGGGGFANRCGMIG